MKEWCEQVTQPLILIVEDELPIRRFLTAALADAGYRWNEASTAVEALRMAREAPPDGVILDLGLPDLDGQKVIEQLREWYRQPIIVLSARDQEYQKVRALDAGADDYVTKPFGVGELLARLRVALRHAVLQVAPSTKIEFGDCRVDLGARLVYREGVEVHLTPLEYKLLITLLQHANKVLTHRFLLKAVWGPNDEAEPHYLRVFVANLRRKLEQDPARPQFIVTEPGVGYRFTLGNTSDGGG